MAKRRKTASANGNGKRRKSASSHKRGKKSASKRSARTARFTFFGEE